MDVVSLCPLRVASLVWQPRRGTWVLTAVAKATYSLEPAESVLAHEQEYPNEDDNHWNDDPARSLYSPCDLVPFKPRADVMLVGHAFAPRKEPVRSVIARLLVGEVNKAVEVFGERSWTQDGSLREGPRFVKMPLRYERASGGPDTVNPVGMRLDARPDAYGSVAVPNLQPTGLSLSDPKTFIEPIGFGPIASSWPARRDRLGRHAATWSSAWSQQPIPEDIDRGYFNAAPRDQQLEALRPNERLVLENLHPEHPRLATNLPGVQPRAFVERRGAAPQELAMICDTLWIDTDRSICTLTWRAQISIEHPGQPGRVLVALVEPGQRLAWSDVERLASAAAAVEDTSTDTPTPRPDTGSTPDGPRKTQTLPFLSGRSDFSAAVAAMGVEPLKLGGTRPGVDTRPRDEEVTATGTPIPKPSGGLPFGSAPVMGLPPIPAASSQPPARRNNTTLDASALNTGAPAWLAQMRGAGSAPSPAVAPPPGSPFSGAMPAPGAPPGSPFPGAPPAASFQAPSPPVPAPSFGAPPPIAPPPVAPPPVAPPPSDSPWAGAAARAAEPPAAPVMGIGATGLGAAVGLGNLGGLPLTGPGGAPVNLGPIPTSSSATPAAPPLVNTASAASSGVTAASNAAAVNARIAATAPASSPASSPQAAPASGPRASGTRPREVVDLLWFDPAALPRIRARAEWKKILDDLRPKEPARKKKDALGFDDDEEEEEAAPPPDPPEVVDRRDVITILARGEAGEADWVSDAIADAVADDGSFTPPLVLVGGELLFPFDELEALKATTTAVTPLVGTDKKLKETVDSVNELLKTPALESSTGVAEGLTSRLKEAFTQANRMLPANYLETQTERMLLEQRHYQKRTVFGAPWVRSLIGTAGGGGQSAVPAYLPGPLGKQLPMFQRFRAKIIAEAHLQQDQYETSPTALKVVAVARVMPLGAAGRVSDKGKA